LARSFIGRPSTGCVEPRPGRRDALFSRPSITPPANTPLQVPLRDTCRPRPQRLCSVPSSSPTRQPSTSACRPGRWPTGATRAEGPAFVRHGRFVRYRAVDIASWLQQHLASTGAGRPRGDTSTGAGRRLVIEPSTAGAHPAGWKRRPQRIARDATGTVNEDTDGPHREAHAGRHDQRGGPATGGPTAGSGPDRSGAGSTPSSSSPGSRSRSSAAPGPTRSWPASRSRTGPRCGCAPQPPQAQNGARLRVAPAEPDPADLRPGADRRDPPPRHPDLAGGPPARRAQRLATAVRLPPRRCDPARCGGGRPAGHHPMRGDQAPTAPPARHGVPPAQRAQAGPRGRGATSPCLRRGPGHRRPALR
jgi:hypothetical protein